MTKCPINIVWLKRDLRLADHAPLQAAEEAGIPYFICCLLEPSFQKHPDWSLRHWQFTYHSLPSMNRGLGSSGRKVDLFFGEATEVFCWALKHYSVRNVFSYQETGTETTWNRDKQVRTILQEHGTQWTEFQRDGILRGIKDRKGWDKKWFDTMHSPGIENRYSMQSLTLKKHPFTPNANLLKELESYPHAFQKPGEPEAYHQLSSFAEERGLNYHKHISKPAESRVSCSRLSTHLAWGNLSVKQAYRFIKQHDQYANHKRPFSAFLQRLKWHCHFMQKFEVECSYEYQCVNRGYESLEHENRSDWLEAWKTGHTGLPLVDALMRCLHETGWINFRMRAMLVSVLCHHLDQDWRRGTNHLARLFLDYEPGIHFTQFQMQAGTTGTNAIRIYNPVKQSLEHDPLGHFIHHWVPELEGVPNAFTHTPWKMELLEQTMCGVKIGETYPCPIIDPLERAKQARKKIWGHRSNPLVRSERARILKTHTRNTSSVAQPAQQI